MVEPLPSNLGWRARKLFIHATCWFLSFCLSRSFSICALALVANFVLATIGFRTSGLGIPPPDVFESRFLRTVLGAEVRLASGKFLTRTEEALPSCTVGRDFRREVVTPIEDVYRRIAGSYDDPDALGLRFRGGKVER